MPQKIVNLFLIFLLTTFILPAQPVSKGNHGIEIIKDVIAYRHVASGDSTEIMADLKKYVPGIEMDLRYATKNNFTGHRLYPYITTTYMRLPAAKALASVQQELNKKNLGLKVFDAYRPYSVTVRMWELIKDERYVADPGKGSGHNRGIAVDLTIIDLTTKKALDMGTDFDNFTKAAHQTYTKLSPAILRNRMMLKEVMEKHGFQSLETEWWHFGYQSPKMFKVLDIGFEDFQLPR